MHWQRWSSVGLSWNATWQYWQGLSHVINIDTIVQKESTFLRKYTITPTSEKRKQGSSPSATSHLHHGWPVGWLSLCWLWPGDEFVHMTLFLPPKQLFMQIGVWLIPIGTQLHTKVWPIAKGQGIIVGRLVASVDCVGRMSGTRRPFINWFSTMLLCYFVYFLVKLWRP